MRLLLCTLVTLTVFTACIIPAPTSEGTKPSIDRPAARPVEVPVGANFGDKIELSSVVLGNNQAYAGESLKVMFNFKVLEEIGADYMIFVHVEDEGGRADRLNIDHAPVRGTYATSKWKVGEMVRDEFDVPVPPGMPVQRLNLIMGFWDAKTDARLPIKNTDKVRHDGNNRLFAVGGIPVAQLQ